MNQLEVVNKDAEYFEAKAHYSKALLKEANHNPETTIKALNIIRDYSNSLVNGKVQISEGLDYESWIGINLDNINKLLCRRNVPKIDSHLNMMHSILSYRNIPTEELETGDIIYTDNNQKRATHFWNTFWNMSVDVLNQIKCES